MKRHKPTKQEIKASFDLYMPYHGVIAMDAANNPEVFKPGICWSIIPASKNRQDIPREHICGFPAMRYLVGRPNTTVIISMWLCLTHRAYMEKRGYQLKQDSK